MAPVMKEFWWLWWPMISRDGCGLSFPDIYLTVEEKPQSGKLTRPGIEPWPARWRQWWPLDQSGSPRYKQKYHHITFWTLPILLLSLRCFSQGSTYKKGLWNQWKTCWRWLWLRRTLDYQVLVIVCARTSYVGTVYVLKSLVVTSSPSCKLIQNNNVQ